MARDRERATLNLWSQESGRTGISGANGTSLTEREIMKIIKLINEQDRLERKNDIVRGVVADEDNLKDWLTQWLERKLG